MQSGEGEANAYLSTQRLEGLNADYLNVGSGVLVFVAFQANKFHSYLLCLIIVIAGQIDQSVSIQLADLLK